MPNIWERRYTLPNGKIGTITHLDPEEFIPYSVVVHTHAPEPQKDWWDSVEKDLGPAGTLEEAEALLQEAGEAA